MTKEPRVKIGDKIGIWTLLEYTGYKLDSRNFRNRIGIFICDCGFKKEAILSTIKCQPDEKCRGYDRHYFKPKIKDGFRSVEQSKIDNARTTYKKYYNKCKLSGTCINISFEHFLEITQKECYYCGKPPSHKINHQCLGTLRGKRHPEGAFVYNGLVKITMSEGFINGNIRSCCHECSRAKLDMDEKDFIKWIKEAYLGVFPYG